MRVCVSLGRVDALLRRLMFAPLSLSLCGRRERKKGEEARRFLPAVGYLRTPFLGNLGGSYVSDALLYRHSISFLRGLGT